MHRQNSNPNPSQGTVQNASQQFISQEQYQQQQQFQQQQQIQQQRISRTEHHVRSQVTTQQRGQL